MKSNDNLIQIVLIEPNKIPYKKLIKNELEEFQKIVEGYIELMSIGKTLEDHTITIIMNEDGKLLNMPINRVFQHTSYEPLIIVGTFFLTAIDSEGYNVSLSDSVCEELIEIFSENEIRLT